MSSQGNMIWNVSIQRVDVGTPHSEPIQWSENRQLAVNSGDHVVVLDPKLPSLQSGITSVNKVKIFSPREIFSITNILYSEMVNLLPVRRFNNTVVSTGDEPFHFTNINEPEIVSHQWTSAGITTRDCSLGVLFNTGELVILERYTAAIDKYRVRIDVFEVMAKEYGVTTGPEILVNSQQLNSLKIRCFSFSQLQWGADVRQFLSIINSRGEVLIFAWNDSQEELSLLGKVETELSIVKHKWSPWTTPNTGKKTTFVSYLSLIGSDNSSILYRISYNAENKSIDWSAPISLSQKSRFLNGRNEWIFPEKSDPVFISTLTGKIRIYRVQSKLKIMVIEKELQNYSASSGIAAYVNGGVQTIVISFEDGKFESFKFNLKSNKLESEAVHGALTNLVSKSLYSFQLINASAVDDGEDDSTPPVKKDTGTPASASEKGETDMRMYLNQDIEGNFVNLGMTLLRDGIISIAFKVIPRNVFHYQIESKSEIQVAFVKLEDFPNQKAQAFQNSTSIAYITNLWFQKYFEIPIFENKSKDRKEGLHKFIEDTKAFKSHYFIDLESLKLEVIQHEEDTLYSSLVRNYSHNSQVKGIQELYNFERQVFKFVISLDDVDEKLKAFVDQSIQRIGDIERLLNTYLSRIILEWAKDKAVSSELDKFLVINCYKSLRKSDSQAAEVFKNIAQDATITIRSKFFEENFKASVDDIDEDDDDGLINSTSNHKWTKCKLSNIPLLQLNNRKDELLTFNYILNTFDSEEGGEMVSELLNTIHYCYISGNKTYAVK
ncbi:uncharacterized protein RJT20DRAFT_60009 [Scheffersomyces xylosifermentans]|uniref:uncharacterized protein n=1 Tax=Scheffersomyces xylosifermentans TaxID=1304137 RepID=UPI00315CE0CC